MERKRNWPLVAKKGTNILVRPHTEAETETVDANYGISMCILILLF